MQTVAGVFTSADDAMRALRRLGSVVSPDRISALFPGASRAELESVPKSEDMPSVARPMAATLGGALGIGLGATLFLPAVGAITVLGVLGSLLAGVAGAVAGGSVGHVVDESNTYGIPADEMYVYEDALRQGRSVVIVFTEGDAMTASARRILDEAGAESVNAARENWWIGLRPSEEAAYVAEGGDFARDEAIYRLGFEAALEMSGRERKYAEAIGELSRRFPEEYALPAFKRGFERGRARQRGWSHAR